MKKLLDYIERKAESGVDIRKVGNLWSISDAKAEAVEGFGQTLQEAVDMLPESYEEPEEVVNEPGPECQHEWMNLKDDVLHNRICKLCGTKATYSATFGGIVLE